MRKLIFGIPRETHQLSWELPFVAAVRRCSWKATYTRTYIWFYFFAFSDVTRKTQHFVRYESCSRHATSEYLNNFSTRKTRYVRANFRCRSRSTVAPFPRKPPDVCFSFWRISREKRNYRSPTPYNADGTLAVNMSRPEHFPGHIERIDVDRIIYNDRVWMGCRDDPHLALKNVRQLISACLHAPQFSGTAKKCPGGRWKFPENCRNPSVMRRLNLWARWIAARNPSSF